MMRASSSLGLRPLMHHMRFAAWPSVGSGSTGGLPSSVRWQMPMSVGICASKRLALRSSAAGELSSHSGSWCDSRLTPERRMLIGCAPGVSLAMRTIASRTLAGTCRMPTTSLRKASSSAAVGLWPTSSRNATSSKLACSARSAIS
jgi:hypothetical protein